MISRSVTSLILLASILMLLSGCAYSRRKDPPSAADVFFGVAEVLFELGGSGESIDERELKKRRAWQCENLSTSELSKLGISGQCDD